MSPQIIINGYWIALQAEKEKLGEYCQNKDKSNFLLRFVQTSLNSKLIANFKEFFSEMNVKAVKKLEGLKIKT